MLSWSRPVTASRRSTGMPPARLADSWRMRRSPPYLHCWAAVNKLSKNERLKASSGATVAVVGGTVPKQHDGWMWDLTVPGNNDHDFYVVVTTASVLVHNDSCPMIGSNGARFTSQEMGRGKGWRIDAENPNPGGTTTAIPRAARWPPRRRPAARVMPR